jgi:TctA family transporter
MAFVLSPLIEGSLIRSLKMAQGSFSIFYSRPIPLIIMGAAMFLLISSLFWKKTLPQEPDEG